MNIAVVGAGLSGLSCALELKKMGFQVQVFESQSHVGGRVQTIEKEGFLLDKGFQVYLPSYQMGQYYMNHKALDLQSFLPGAMICEGAQHYCLSDPFRNPSTLFKTLFHPATTLKDQLLTAKLLLSASSGKTEFSKALSTRDYLQDFGFSQKFIKQFFEPFFSGVFLDQDLRVPHHYFLYLFGRFAKGLASLPSQGMAALPKQLAERLGEQVLHVNKPVDKVQGKTLCFADGEKVGFERVVLATGLSAAQQLLSLETTPTKFHGVTTHYFKSSATELNKNYLYLNVQKSRVVNHVAHLTACAPSYAPDGWHLFSVNLVGSVQDASVDEVMQDLTSLFGEQEVSGWQWLHRDKVVHALPAHPYYGQRDARLSESTWVCGDDMESPSIQGALSSGYKVAHLISAI